MINLHKCRPQTSKPQTQNIKTNNNFVPKSDTRTMDNRRTKDPTNSKPQIKFICKIIA